MQLPRLLINSSTSFCEISRKISASLIKIQPVYICVILFGTMRHRYIFIIEIGWLISCYHVSTIIMFLYRLYWLYLCASHRAEVYFDKWYMTPEVKGLYTTQNTLCYDRLELIKRDCFPSLHTAISAVALFFIMKRYRNLPFGNQF